MPSKRFPVPYPVRDFLAYSVRGSRSHRDSARGFPVRETVGPETARARRLAWSTSLRPPSAVLFPALLFLAILGGGAAWGEDAPRARLDGAGTYDVFSGGVPRSPADLKRIEERVQTVSREVIGYTVGLQVGPRQGSGVIISEDGYVLTAAHVIDQPLRPATVILPDGRRLAARTLGLNRTADAGLVKILPPEGAAPSTWPHAKLGRSTDVAPGQWCLAIGHPNGFQSGREPVVRLGRVLACGPDAGVTTDCALVGGDSGGPLFDMEGRVVGVHSRIGASITLNIHVPVDAYRNHWDRLVRGDAWGHVPGNEPFLGVRGDAKAESARITEVFRNSPAEKAGVQVGDVILRFEGQALSNFASLADRVNQKRPGDRVTIQVRRGDQTLELELEIGKRENE